VTPSRRRQEWLLPAIACVIILTPFAYSAARFAWVSLVANRKPFLEVPSATSQRCVRDPHWMRQNHRVLLEELRDKTVRDGIRSEVTLRSCSQCHKDKSQFCDKCHQAVNLYPDCFNCHSYATDHPVALLESGP
jgi:hypothetical protein